MSINIRKTDYFYASIHEEPGLVQEENKKAHDEPYHHTDTNVSPHECVPSVSNRPPTRTLTAKSDMKFPMAMPDTAKSESQGKPTPIATPL